MPICNEVRPFRSLSRYRNHSNDSHQPWHVLGCCLWKRMKSQSNGESCIVLTWLQMGSQWSWIIWKGVEREIVKGQGKRRMNGKREEKEKEKVPRYLLGFNQLIKVHESHYLAPTGAQTWPPCATKQREFYWKLAIQLIKIPHETGHRKPSNTVLYLVMQHVSSRVMHVEISQFC